MPLEISVIDMKEEDKMKNNEYHDLEWDYDPYTVYVGEHRILTLFSECYQTTTKWFQDLQKSTANNKHGCLLVGVCADRNPDLMHWDIDTRRYPNPEKTPYHLLQLCIGSQCFLYRLPHPHYEHIPKALIAFFANPRVIAVGMNMRAVIKRLEDDHGIKFANPVDLNVLAVKGMKRDDLDLGRYDLDRLAKAVLGKHWDVIRPDERVQWFSRWRSHWWNDTLDLKKVEYATVDPYLCFMIGSELLDMLDDKWYPREFKKFLLKNKKQKKRGKTTKKF
ncbi:uncharacterized protein [Nicotiana sylvestris]|uniref:uncharacterized protein n=1 Tax=Nicotiana sylvestris TaxID=4096 RepID=UPI00388CCDA0